ncbi:MAG: hypothetical protein WCW27_00355 [Patescibacteria group bacterium]|jgi:hypothetical protein
MSVEHKLKNINKKVLIINGIALAILLTVAGLMLYGRFFKPTNQPGFRDSRAMSIEDICSNMKNNNINRPVPTNMPNNMPNSFPNDARGGSNVNQADMEARRTLTQEICADGTVTVEEKAQFEALNN